MSDDQGPTGQPAPAAPPPHRSSGPANVAMLLGGLVMLLPGICSLAFMTGGVARAPGPLITLWLICLAISAGGVALIVKAVR